MVRSPLMSFPRKHHRTRFRRQYLFKSKDRLIAAVVHEGMTGPIDPGWTESLLLHHFYRRLYPQIVEDIDTIENNWKCGRHVLKRINCHSENSKGEVDTCVVVVIVGGTSIVLRFAGVYCLQYDDEKIISGLRDNTIKVWDTQTLQCTTALTGHTGSVLCLQYDQRVIISGSSDSTVR